MDVSTSASDAGYFPADWHIIPMRELFTFQNGVNADRSAYGRGIAFINVLEVITNPTLKYVDVPGRVHLAKTTTARFEVRRGDVLFNRTSETDDEIGLAAVYVDSCPVVFGGFVIRARPRTGVVLILIKPDERPFGMA